MLKCKARNLIPQIISKRLWGDRKKWGLVVQEDDPCWIEWQATYDSFYSDNQREGVGIKINDAGYTVMSSVDFDGKTVMEIGAGDIRHHQHWNSKPKEYVLVDIDEEMMLKAQTSLDELEVPHTSILVTRGQPIPAEDSSVDVVVSFYSLEHIYPLQEYLEDLKRVLRPGGVLVGAIPAEGGLAWGLGRFITSRRWIKKKSTINPDKLICWEHPNFADLIVRDLEMVMGEGTTTLWPFCYTPFLDINLIVKFIYKK